MQQKRGSCWQCEIGENTSSRMEAIVLLASRWLCILLLCGIFAACNASTGITTTSTVSLNPDPTPYTGPMAYTADNHTITAIDATNGHVRWQHPFIPVGLNESLFSDSLGVYLGAATASAGPSYLEALNAYDGSIRWRESSNTGFPVGSVGTTLITSYTGNATPTAGSSANAPAPTIVDGLDAQTGKLQWSFQAIASFSIAVTPHVVLVIENAPNAPEQMLGYDVKTGHLLWHVSGDHLGFSPPFFEFNYPFIAGDRIYLASLSGTPSFPGTQALVALDDATGQMLWRDTFTSIPIWKVRPFAATNDQTYIGAIGGESGPTFGQTSLMALDAATGHIRWQSAFGTIDDQLGIKGVADAHGVYFVSYSGDHDVPRLMALHASTGQQLWEHMLSGMAYEYGYNPPLLGNGIVYTAEYTPQTTTLEALNATDGSFVWRSDAPLDTTISYAI
jgi:outer membrane protein assembly factor BamB